jgi:mono/diheme cytochrome c family protein
VKLAVGFAVAGTLAAGVAQAGGTEDVAAGRALAERLCARCHAIEGPGPVAAAPPLGGFARRWPIESLAEAMAEGLTVGHGPMPEFVFSDAEIDALLAYLESVQE